MIYLKKKETNTSKPRKDVTENDHVQLPLEENDLEVNTGILDEEEENDINNDLELGNPEYTSKDQLLGDPKI